MANGPAGPAAGWYPDPGGTAGLRYWDGTGWTASTAPAAPPAPGPGGSLTAPSAPAAPIGARGAMPSPDVALPGGPPVGVPQGLFSRPPAVPAQPPAAPAQPPAAPAQFPLPPAQPPPAGGLPPGVFSGRMDVPGYPYPVQPHRPKPLALPIVLLCIGVALLVIFVPLALFGTQQLTVNGVVIGDCGSFLHPNDLSGVTDDNGQTCSQNRQALFVGSGVIALFGAALAAGGFLLLRRRRHARRPPTLPGAGAGPPPGLWGGPGPAWGPPGPGWPPP
jgi:hypothetical protein